MSDSNTPLIYVKSGCPWCSEATEFLDDHGIEYKTVDVHADSKAFEEMKKISGQSKAPTMVWNGEILADFGAAELEPWLRERDLI
ncbi:MAG: glutaredoxin family protein [Verrucomicrobiae bacterium]|nr:glutaredoxin family protein [Verrucomicrobiae bacterium]